MTGPLSVAGMSDSTLQTLLALVTVGGYVLTLLLIRWVLLHKSRNPTASVAWIMIIFFVPIAGGILFLLFGVNRVHRRKESKFAATMEIRRALPEFVQYQLLEHELENRTQRMLCRVCNAVDTTRPTEGNRIEVLNDTNRTLGLIKQAILEARSFIHLEYYIWQPDQTGTALRDLLVQRAKDGIKIRFLYDGLGSVLLSRRFFQPMVEAGIEVSPFLPGSSLRERWSINLRNHRKIIIVDSEIGFTGGMNIADEYLGRNPKLGYWRDTHLRMVGPTVNQLHQVFVEDWYYATGEQLVDRSMFPPALEHGNTVAQVLSGGPDHDVPSFHTVMFAALSEARENITLSSAFFVPTEGLVTALEAAARRGVKVRILVAGKVHFHWTLLAARSFYDSLLQAGVQIWEYTQGMHHAKTLTIDGHWSLVGSPNFDPRSLMLNFEVGVVMYDSRIATQLEEHFNEDITKAVRIEPDRWSARSTWQHLQENACRLFAPVL